MENILENKIDGGSVELPKNEESSDIKGKAKKEKIAKSTLEEKTNRLLAYKYEIIFSFKDSNNKDGKKRFVALKERVEDVKEYALVQLAKLAVKYKDISYVILNNGIEI